MMTVATKPRLHLRKGDMVEVIGGKYRGKRGKVLRVVPQAGRAIVQGVNIVKRHVNPSQKIPQGGAVEKEALLPTARLMIVCAKCGEAVRVGHRVLGDGSKVRYCKHCGEQMET